MSQWAQLQELPEEAQQQIYDIYGEHFPIEVRYVLAQSIEDKLWNQLDTDNPQHETIAKGLVASLIDEIKLKVNTENDYVMRLKLSHAAKNFQQYVNDAHVLVHTIKRCLNYENKLIQQFKQKNLSVSNGINRDIKTQSIIKDEHRVITQELEILRKKTIDADEEIQRIQQEQEQILLRNGEIQNRQSLINQWKKSPNGQSTALIEKLRNEMKSLDIGKMLLGKRAATLHHDCTALIEKPKVTFATIISLQHRILDDELNQWKRRQQLSGNGVPFDNNIDQIQEWCEILAEIIWKNRTQIKRIEELFQHLSLNTPSDNNINDQLLELNNLITNLLTSLVMSTFIIEKQPPQVMKKNTKFESKVRLLVGGKLNVHMTPPKVKVTILNETQINSLIKNQKIIPGDTSGEIKNNTRTMQYHCATRELSANFENMQLSKIRRAAKKGTEFVTDEKFALLMQSQFNVGGEELVFHVWTLSLPVVVIVHVNQEPLSWATITWDNAFAEHGRVPFVVPDKVPWFKIGEVLNYKFTDAIGTGLSEDHLHFLACKVLQNSQVEDYNNALISDAQFNKDHLLYVNSKKPITFFEWFYVLLKFVDKYLKDLWNDNLIMGFIRKSKAEEMLLKQKKGTFLLRFSDTELGGITIGICKDGHKCDMLQPFTSKELSFRGLADYINDLKEFTYLYPDIPKDRAFGKHYAPLNKNNAKPNNGYVPTQITVNIKESPSVGSANFIPNTPQSLQQNFSSPKISQSSFRDDLSLVSSTGINSDGATGTISDLEFTDILNMEIGDDILTDFDLSHFNDLITSNNALNSN